MALSADSGAGDRFSFRQHGVRIFAGPGVLEKRLGAAVRKADARRAFVITSRSVAASGLADRVKDALGELYVGQFGAIDRDTSFAVVQEAHRQAETAGADILIAAGGGSVLVGARAVAIFLGEQGDPFDLMTQYPAGEPPVSPRLEAPKVPIINVPLTPTTAMDRAGVGLKNLKLDQRMEYYDPKVRPTDILWDAEALMATPHRIFVSTAFSVLVRTLGDVAEASTGPLDAADRLTALNLAVGAVKTARTGVLGLEERVNLCTAAFLQTRIEDARGRLRPKSIYGGDYGAATALHLQFPEISQGDATSAVYQAALASAPVPDISESRRLGRALGVWRESMSPEEARGACVDSVMAIFRDAGMPTRLRDVGVPKELLPRLAELTLKNFNHDAGGERADARRLAALELLNRAW